MALKQVIALIDAEIATLRQVSALLAAASAVSVGHPPKVQPGTLKVSSRRKQRHHSPEGRARIAEATQRHKPAQKKVAR